MEPQMITKDEIRKAFLEVLAEPEMEKTIRKYYGDATPAIQQAAKEEAKKYNEIPPKKIQPKH